MHSNRGTVAEPAGDHPSSDHAVLVSVAQGDTAAFARLYDRFAAPVYGLCRRILRDDDYAEDATLQALLDVWRSAPRYDPSRANPLTWALTIAHRRAVDHVRALRAATQHEARAVSHGYTPTVDTVIDTVLARAEHQQLHAGLAALTARQREALEIIYYQGHTHTEAAALLGIPLGTVETRTRDTLRSLRTTMVDAPDRDCPAPETPFMR